MNPTSLLPLSFLPVVLYAEMHYRFRYFFSFLRKAEPEIYADAPHRIEPGLDIPLLLLAKDADQFPCTIQSLSVTLSGASLRPMTIDLIAEPFTVNDRFASRVFTIPRPAVQGWVKLDVEFEIDCGSGVRTYRNDNLRTASHAPLRVYLADEPIPLLDGLLWGEAHSHSNYTDDQVEFGAPLEPTIPLARSMGLSFCCTTDHSYDLDDEEGNFLRNDPALPKWHRFQQEAAALNDSVNGFIHVRGEEVSCRDRNGHNVHLLLYGSKQFFHGSGDSAERLFRTWCENSIADVLHRREAGTAAFASHAKEPVPFSQQVVFDRTTWDDEELRRPQLDGMQFANGKRDSGFQRGYAAWVRLLLEGRRLVTLAGNDAHGNFNRFRQLQVPFVKAVESAEQIFGGMRTGVFCRVPTEEFLIDALRTGVSIISDGPLVNLTVEGSFDPTAVGFTFEGTEFHLKVHARSTDEYGGLKSVRVLRGNIGESSESLIAEERLDTGKAFEMVVTLHVDRPCYLRAEATTHADRSVHGHEHFCYTNPVWLRPTAATGDSAPTS